MYLHEWIISQKGLFSTIWSPLIYSNSIIKEWQIINHSFNYKEDLTLGGQKVLQGFAQYPLRILEQSFYTHFKPYLNIGKSGIKPIIFFNFPSLIVSDFKENNKKEKIFKAWADKEETLLLAQSNSYNGLARLLGVSNVTIKNNMNWNFGISYKDFNEELSTLYLREVNHPIRNIPLRSQLSPKLKYPTVKLLNKTLFDLIPGKLYAILVKILQEYGKYNNERDLWISLNPSLKNKLSSLSFIKQKQYLNNRVGRYMNVMKPSPLVWGNKTELGLFYFCRNPDFLSGLAKTASSLFAVSTLTGLAIFYKNNSQAGDRGTVRRNRNNNTVSKQGLRYIDYDIFIKYFPDAKNKSSYQLNSSQLKKLPLNKRKK